MTIRSTSSPTQMVGPRLSWLMLVFPAVNSRQHSSTRNSAQPTWWQTEARAHHRRLHGTATRALAAHTLDHDHPLGGLQWSFARPGGGPARSDDDPVRSDDDPAGSGGDHVA